MKSSLLHCAYTPLSFSITVGLASFSVVLFDFGMIPFRLAIVCALLGAGNVVYGDGLAGLPSCAVRIHSLNLQDCISLTNS
jgi:hypothetical protein